MASLSQISDAPNVARKILGGKGKKLHAHEAHVRRAEKGSYVISHDLRDRDGNPPTDGQRSTKEYTAANEAEMLAHMQQHMGAMQPGAADDDEDDQPGATQ